MGIFFHQSILFYSQRTCASDKKSSGSKYFCEISLFSQFVERLHDCFRRNGHVRQGDPSLVQFQPFYGCLALGMSTPQIGRFWVLSGLEHREERMRELSSKIFTLKSKVLMVRKLKHHEQKLLKKVDFLNWKSDDNHREAAVMRRYHVQKRDDYIK
jgi:hypothetical protein